MSEKKVHQFRCIQFRVTCILLFVRFCLEGTRDVRRPRFARGSLGEVFTLGTRGISRVRREFSVLAEVRSREKKLFAFRFFLTSRKPETALGTSKSLVLVFRPRPPSFIQYGGFVEFQSRAGRHEELRI